MSRTDTLENTIVPEEGEVFVETEFPGYFISNYGRMYSYRCRYLSKTPTYQTLSFYTDKHGYKRVSLQTPDGHTSASVHRLVYATFNSISWRDFKSQLTIDHLDGDKSNNRLDNLELVSQSENVYRSWYVQMLRDKQYKPVNKYDLDGRYIATYKSTREAVLDTNNNEARDLEALMVSVKCVCNRRQNRKSAMGYQWRFADEFEPGVDIEKCVDAKCLNRAKRVAQYKLDGTLVKIWPSAYSVGKELGIDSSPITANARGKSASSHGYVWRYVDEEK